MSYIKAADILPADLLETIQKYVEGKCIYIPKNSEHKAEWGAQTKIKEELKIRNQQIYNDYKNGYGADLLVEKYFLSLKSIQRIIRQEKTNNK